MPLVLVKFILEEGWVTVLLHILLGRLIYVHLCHLCSSCVSSGLSLLRLLTIRCLDFLELFENVLVVQQSVREFVLEVLARQEAFDTALKHWYFQKLMNIRTLCWVALQHHGDNVRNGWTEMRR